MNLYLVALLGDNATGEPVEVDDIDHAATIARDVCYRACDDFFAEDGDWMHPSADYMAGDFGRGWVIVRAHTASEAMDQADLYASRHHPDQHDLEFDHALIRAGMRSGLSLLAAH